MRFSVFFALVLLLFLNCNQLKTSLRQSTVLVKNDSDELNSLKNWYVKAPMQGNVPGISLNHWYDKKERKSKAKQIIVAVIDTQIDIKHEDLLGQIWINTKEIDNNGIDDDNNGYVDDVNGWNFVGTKSGGYIVWGNFEFVRIIREWNSRFKDKKEN